MRLVIYILVSKHYFAAKFTEYYSIRLLRFLIKGEWKGKKPSVYVCLFVFLFYLEKLINLGAFWFCRVSVILVSCLESETGRGGLCGSPCLTGIATAAPIKVLVPLLGYYLILRNSKFFIYFL